MGNILALMIARLATEKFAIKLVVILLDWLKTLTTNKVDDKIVDAVTDALEGK